MKQYEAVIATLERLGGVATLGQLYQEVFKIKKCEWKTKTPYASIRRIVQQRDEIFKVKPGLYALKKYRSKLDIVPETQRTKDSKEVQRQNHYYYQGILLTIGNLRGYDTFVPHQDKNQTFLQQQKLSSISTLNEVPPFSYERFVNRSKTIDAIWFNNRKMPDNFFEVEHSTNFQNSLDKYNNLQDFHAKMYIVANNKRKRQYQKTLDSMSFESIQKRVEFLNYEQVVKEYEHEMQSQKYESKF